MRRDKTAARILLILSVVHVAVAAPAIVRQRSLDIVKDMRPGLEKRGNSDDESPHPLLQVGNDLPATLGTSPSQDDVQLTSGTPPQDNLLPESGTLQLHNQPAPTPGAPSAPDDMPPGSGTPQSQNDLVPTSEAPPLQDDRPAASGFPPSYNDQSSTSRTPSSQDETSSASGDRELPNGPPAGSEDPQLHDDPLSQHTGEPSRTSPTALGAPQLQNDESGEYDASWRWNYDFRANEAASSSSDSSSDFNSEVPPPAPEAHTFFNDALKQKLWAFGTYAAVAGDAAGLTLAVQKLIDLKGNSHGAQPAGRDLAGSGVVGRGTSTHPQPPQIRRRMLSLI